MRWMIASDIHGSAYLLQKDDRSIQKREGR